MRTRTSAFLPKVAFAVFGIQDADYLAAHAPDKSYLDMPNGTGPYKLVEWSKGNRMTFKAFDGYWGDKALTPDLELRWSDEAAQRLPRAPVGQRRRHRQPRRR